MARTNTLGGWVTLSLVISSLAPPIVSAAVKRHPGPRHASAPATVGEIIDGTPRPRAAATLQAAGRRATGRSDIPSAVAPGGGPVTSPSTILDNVGMASPLGGDDVLIATLPGSSPPFVYLQIATDGRLFVALATVTSPLQLTIYRSTDSGDTWTVWSTFVPGVNTALADFIIAEGDANRAFILYRAGNSVSGRTEARVARADLDTDTPSWTFAAALADPAVDFLAAADFDTDAWAYSDYYIYVVGIGDDGNGRDAWFARSFDLGATFETPIRIADVTDSSVGMTDARISAGSGGYIHALYSQFGAVDFGLHYRRAANFGGSAWETEQTLDAVDNGVIFEPGAFAAARANDRVLVLGQPGAAAEQCRYSADAGATWPLTNVVTTGLNISGRNDRIAFAGGNLVVGGQDFDADLPATTHYRLVRSTTGDPADLAAPQDMSVHPTLFPNVSAIASDPSRGDRIAAVWYSTDGLNTMLRFDAEWRRDPGYANTEVGFPIGVQGGGQTPPAVADVDGDPDLEIVFGTRSGEIYVVDPDGTTKPGWPVSIGGMPYDAPVAVGTLTRTQGPVVVAGNTAGQVFAFDADGDLLPGWPVTMNDASDVFVSIGALGPPNLRYVVATCGYEIRALRYDGVNVAPEWGDFSNVITRPAAIGDVDGDGTTEVVTLKGEWFHTMVLGQGPPKAFRQFPGETFSDAPTLADIDNNGTIEIAAPTYAGKMYLLNYDGTDYSSSWPITVGSVPLTAAAMSQILGTDDIDIAFAEQTGPVHLFQYTGVEQTGYPRSATGLLYTPPMIYPVNTFVSNINIGDAYPTAHSWRNIPAFPVPGWPRNLPSGVEETFAAGDIDGDGRSEIVVLGVDFLTVFDVATAPPVDARNYWPMYAHDAQRTGCIDCPEDVLTAVDDTPPAPASNSLAVNPNPFNPATTISYEIAKSGPVTLAVYDVTGRHVATLIRGEYREANRYEIRYDAGGASGVYFVRLDTAGGVVTRKMVVLK